MHLVIVQGDIVSTDADFILMKHADQFFGADRAVAQALGVSESLPKGERRIMRGSMRAGGPVCQVLFMGVGRLHDFRYQEIQGFGAEGIKAIRELARDARQGTQSGLPAVTVATTIHGPGYGLDTEQSLLSLVAGFVEGARGFKQCRILIFERDQKRFDLLESILERRAAEMGLVAGPWGYRSDEAAHPREKTAEVISFGRRVEHSPRLFIAMPFDDEFLDEFEIGFCEAGRTNNFVCERLDVAAFTGDIMAEIKSRIISSAGVIALLNGHNPNVFLEIGFAFAHAKPTILVARDDVKLPFDVQGHRCLKYRSIVELRKQLTAEIGALRQQGLLPDRAVG